MALPSFQSRVFAFLPNFVSLVGHFSLATSLKVAVPPTIFLLFLLHKNDKKISAQQLNKQLNTISTNNDRDNKITETVNHILALWSETRFMPKSMAIQVQGNFWLVHQVFNTNSTKIQTHAKGFPSLTSSDFVFGFFYEQSETKTRLQLTKGRGKDWF